MTDDKQRVNIEDLPVPLRELDKEEQEDVTGGIGGVNPTINPTVNPTRNPNPGINPIENPGGPHIRNP